MSAELAAAQRHFAAHLRDPRQPAPPGIEERRLGVYRELVFNNLEGFLRTGFPVLYRLLSEDDWTALAREFLAVHRCRTPYFLAIGQEFLAFLEQREPSGREPPWLLELAHYEWVELALDVDSAEAPAPRPGLDPLAAVPLLSPLALVLAYRWPVHRIGRDYQPAEAPAAPTFLLVYRDRGDRVRFMELTGATARLLDAVRENEGSSGAELLEHLAPALGLDAAAAREHGARQLAELAETGAVYFR